jgi:25S rRNA (adenine2142-N1)-methyltransferase
MFHKLTRERDLALKEGDSKKVKSCEKSLEEMGGRAEYQRASQLSTSFHSTSKWVLGHLANNGWLYGIKTSPKAAKAESETASRGELTPKDGHGRKRIPRRTTRILEVGAINTELLDAAGMAASALFERKKGETKSPQSSESSERTKNSIHVRAIDIHSMEERIEEADFLQLPLISPDDPTKRYDVIVCSMVLNCVTTPVDRGKMLAKLYHHLRPGGLCFFTIPKFCVTKSAFLTHSLFVKMLGENGVGFTVKSTKESPRVAFFILERPMEDSGSAAPMKRKLDPSFTKERIRNKGKKFPNQFSVVLKAEHIFGK